MSIKPALRSFITSSEKKTSAGSIVHTLLNPGTDSPDPIILFEEFFFQEKDGYPSRLFNQFEEFIYMFYGELHHTDDLGNSKTIHKGDALRVISGTGIHVTDTVVQPGINHGIRIWVNTCIKDRALLPDFTCATSPEFPKAENNSMIIRTIAGEDSPLKVCGEVVIKDILLAAGSATILSCKEAYTSMIYILSGDNGSVTIGKDSIEPGSGLVFNSENEIGITAGIKPSRFIFISAEPVNEPYSPEDLVSWF